MLHNIVEIVLPFCIFVLEAIGIIVIMVGALKAFVSWIKSYFNKQRNTYRLDLAESLALGLEFKLGAEILKTVLIGTLEEIYVLAAIIILRVILTLVIHWEISIEQKNCKENQ